MSQDWKLSEFLTLLCLLSKNVDVFMNPPKPCCLVRLKEECEDAIAGDKKEEKETRTVGFGF